MEQSALAKLEDLLKTLTIGSYNASPGNLVQGGALAVEDVSPVMNVVTFEDKHIKLQKEVKVSKTKGQLVQFNRTLSYGVFGGSAQFEGQLGGEDTGSYVRAVVPMAYYSNVRRVSVPANMADTQDGVKAEDREAKAAALKIAGDIEFDLFRGKSDFSNAGVFDGAPSAIPNMLPSMMGLDVQIRQSDTNQDTQDLMFSAFGSSLSNIIAGGGTLGQSTIEDAWVRGVMNHGSADRLMTDPLVLSAYSKASYANKERINLGGSAQEITTGADIRKQAVSGGVVSLEASRFLSAQTGAKPSRNGAPGAPSIAAGTQAGASTSFQSGQVYIYAVSAENELGESQQSGTVSVTISSTGNSSPITITPSGTGTTRWFNVFRSAAGSTVTKLIGRVKAAASGNTTFTDLNNRLPGGITGFLVQMDTMEIKELAAYSRMKLAVTDLTVPEAHYRFCCLAVMEPRKNVLIDSLIGSF